MGDSQLSIAFRATDVTGQKRVDMASPPDRTIELLLKEIVKGLGLPAKDADGRPQAYHPRLDREGRHLVPSERVGDALQPGDELVIQPSIDAGVGA